MVLKGFWWKQRGGNIRIFNQSIRQPRHKLDLINFRERERKRERAMVEGAEGLYKSCENFSLEFSISVVFPDASNCVSFTHETKISSRLRVWLRIVRGWMDGWARAIRETRPSPRNELRRRRNRKGMTTHGNTYTSSKEDKHEKVFCLF